MRPRSERHRVFAALYRLQVVWEWAGYRRHRRGIGRGVRGRTLEVGVGTGFSLPWYAAPPAVAADVSMPMLRRARSRADRLGLKVAFVCAEGGALPFRDATFDTVVTESTMCSVGDVGVVARELLRVLDPAGQYRFVEHGRSSRRGYRHVQRTIARPWRRIMAGCRLDGDPVAGIVSAGFQPTKLRRCNGDAVARGTFHPGQR